MIADIALTWVGTPFKWQGRVRAGCDCKGLVAGVAKEAGRPEADSVQALAGDYRGGVDEKRLNAGLESLFDRADDVQAGDILLLKIGGKAQHLAIATKAENGRAKRMVHCYHTGPQKVIDVPVGTITQSAIVAVYRWRECR
jgi:cell wall-associated NlpC family hydrolase